MQIIVKCWTPEHYDGVTHAVIPMDVGMINVLLNRLELANTMKSMGGNSEFMGLQYDRYDPYFIDVPVDLRDQFDMTEEDFDMLCDEGYHILPAKMDDYSWDEVGMRPCMLMVMAGDNDTGRVYWYGYDKHGDASCRAETYSLTVDDLRKIKETLQCQSTSSK